ncbi:maleylpyruvate isomerase family mycothiol-dependent enzyme [Microlunatus capsulatus]|uniref:Maleylpyruvate isomerase n=1 Tax=Microlunatus capsulatus TaxID=99117 RepID=A0ABS4ZBJ8_9ACTN|nr:maleylpyruvate isomerase family mycothiol-dependent enzyme [Microlunatus capsulatus]MBP2418436.1 maleylpyruvate isomerase [Microlunatus capsulatus]
MPPDAPAPDPDAQRDQQDRLHDLLRDATSRLLGATIAVADEDWQAPSRLPGWSRGHLATHLARQADALRRLVDGALAGRRAEMYPAPGQRDDEIEAGAGRSGLELQIDLDTSAGLLADAFEALQEAGRWDEVVELRGGLRAPARLLPLARLLEVAVHHVDLGLGREMADLDDATADWLLELCGFRLRERDEFPRLELVSPTSTLVVGSSGATRTVRGRSALLLGWLTGRTDGADLEGVDGLRLPAF